MRGPLANTPPEGSLWLYCGCHGHSLLLLLLVLLGGRDRGRTGRGIETWRCSSSRGIRSGTGRTAIGAFRRRWVGVSRLGDVMLLARGLMLRDDWTRGCRGRSGRHGGRRSSSSNRRLGCRSIGDHSCDIDWSWVNNGRGHTARNWRGRTGVFEAREVVPWESRALRGTEGWLRRAIVCVLGDVGLVRISLRLRRAHLVPDGIVLVLLSVVLVEVDHIHDSLGVLLLLLLGDAILL